MESPGRGEHSEPGGTAWGCGSGGGARPGLPMGSMTSRWFPEPSRSIRMKSTSHGSSVVVASISRSSRGRKARVAYGFDDIALVPGTITVNPNEVDISWELCGRRFDLPIIAGAQGQGCLWVR